jgi:hypothetical protein
MDLLNVGFMRAVATLIIRFFKEPHLSTMRVLLRNFWLTLTATRHSERAGMVSVLVKDKIDSLSKLLIKGAMAKPLCKESVLFGQSRIA